FGHDYSMIPVAKVTAIQPSPNGPLADMQFPDEGVYDFADTVFQMIKGGFLNAVSVGFRAIESQLNPAGGRDYLRQELLELSIVPVPADPQALIVRRGISGKQVNAWEHTLNTWASKFSTPTRRGFTREEIDNVVNHIRTAFETKLPTP